MAEKEISCNQFTNWLVTQEPVYDEMIIADIRPEDGWIGHVETGTWPAFSSNSHTFDRFKSVFPNLTAPWTQVPNSGSCIGTPCDPTENCLGWGSHRTTYYLEQQSWHTPLLCFDQMLLVTRAKEHFRQIISDILKPATNWIMSNFLKKRAAQFAQTKLLANATMSPFTYTWETTGGGDIFMDTVGGDPTSKLTPQMLQRRYMPQLLRGALGKTPFKDMNMLQLITDMETVWELDRAANDNTLFTQWRWIDWTQGEQYYKYAWAGKLGNFAVRVDPYPLRFNQVAAGRYQLVLPYVNTADTTGIGDDMNNDFLNAQFQFSLIHHVRAIQALVLQASPVNPEMPFASRNFGGRWQFVMDNLGADANGCVIENKRRNKGQFIADFKIGIKPQYVEFEELIFHKREPACITVVHTCNSDPGYPTQHYDSCGADCTPTFVFTPTAASGGNYKVALNTISCNGVPIVHNAVDAATLAALVAALPAILGTWAVVQGSTTQIQLTGSQCDEIVIPWLAA